MKAVLFVWKKRHTHTNIYKYIYTQVHLKKFEYREKVITIFFFYLFQKEKLSYILDLHFKDYFCFNFDD